MSSRRQSTDGYHFGPSDEPILRAFARYLYLTARQVTRLLYSPTSLKYGQARLKRLADGGYLQRLFLPRPSRTGSAPLVFTLSRKGLNTLAELGHPVEQRYRPAEVKELGYLHLRHTLELNDVLIAWELLCRTQPALSLARLEHERLLKLHPVPVTLPGGERTSVIPDAWLELHVAGRYQECYCLELDRGTSAQKVWRRKISALCAYADGPYQETFGTESITVVVVATPGERRRDELLVWTEAELVARGWEHQADLFRFAGLAAAEMTPEDVFLTPHWYTPFRTTGGAPLLRLTDPEVMDG